MELKNLKEQKNEVLKCSRCGTCRAACPVFKVTGQELMVARGRLEIAESILAGKIDFTDKSNKILDTCLLCGACFEACPSKVKVDDIVRYARIDRVKKYGLSGGQEFIFRYILENRSLFSFTLDIASSFQNLFTNSCSREHMRHLPFFVQGYKSGRFIPKLASKRLSNMFPQVITPKKRKFKVGFFPGCLLEYIYTNIGKAIIEVLVKNDCEVVIPKNLKCCGTSLLISGEEKTAKRLALSNVKSFLSDDLDVIIVGCASCGSTLKNEYPKLLLDSGIDVKKFSNKVKDISEFLLENIPYTQKMTSGLNADITYHDPCHLRRKQNIFKAPREILKSIDKLSFIEMADANMCCGGGGSFSFYNYEISDKIRELKIKNIENAQAQYVATSCPGCIMHIEDGLVQKGSKIKVVHVIELLNQMMKC